MTCVEWEAKLTQHSSLISWVRERLITHCHAVYKRHVYWLHCTHFYGNGGFGRLLLIPHVTRRIKTCILWTITITAVAMKSHPLLQVEKCANLDQRRRRWNKSKSARVPNTTTVANTHKTETRQDTVVSVWVRDTVSVCRTTEVRQ